MVIKNGTVSLVVKDVDSAVNQIMEIATRHGGDVRQSTNNKTGDLRVADMLILVESSQFDKAMAAIRGIDGLVDRKVDKTESQEVSEEFVDVKAQIATLEATERQLRAQLERTSRTEDILAVQRELTNIRGQIDRLQSRANFLDRRSAMSTITLHIEMPPPANSAGKPRSAVDPVAEWRFSESVAASWRASLRVVQAVGTVIVSVLVFCWWLVPLAALGWVAARLIRRRSGNGVPPAPPAPAAGA